MGLDIAAVLLDRRLAVYRELSSQIIQRALARLLSTDIEFDSDSDSERACCATYVSAVISTRWRGVDSLPAAVEIHQSSETIIRLAKIISQLLFVGGSILSSLLLLLLLNARDPFDRLIIGRCLLLFLNGGCCGYCHRTGEL